MIVQKKNSYGRQVVADTMAEAAVGSGGHNGSSRQWRSQWQQ